MNNPLRLLLAFCLCTAHTLSAQPLFQINESPVCAGHPLSITPLLTNTFTTYHWDMGNGLTGSTYNPPAVTYASTGTYTISLTVTKPSPFPVIDTIKILGTSTYWISTGLFCGNDGNPDFYLKLSASNGNVLFVTPENYEVPLPSSFLIPGVLTQSAFKIAVLDRDYSVWCQPDDYMGEVTVPANTTAGIVQNTAAQLKLQLTTKSVTSTTFSYSVTVGAMPNKPVVSCDGDSLRSNYATSNQWFSADGIAQPNGLGQAFKPSQPGYYYVEYFGQACKAQSNWIKYPECSVVSAQELVWWSQQIRVAPNPSTGPLTVLLPESFSGKVEFSLRNPLGEQLLSRSDYVVPGAETPIDASGLPAGLYFLSVSGGGQTAQKQVLIQH